MSDLTLVVPAYNEANRFDPAPWRDFLACNRGSSLCFVNDGSTDGTDAVLEAFRLDDVDRITVVPLVANRGKAEAVRVGMLAAFATGASRAGFIDADLAAPLSEVPTMMAELDAYPAAWAVFGSRVKLLGRDIARSERRHYLGRVFATCASLALSLPVYDSQCGLKLFRNLPAVQQAFATPFQSRWIFDVELLARLADIAGDEVSARIREVPLQRWAEQGASRLRVRDFIRAPIELLRIRASRGKVAP